MRSLTILLAGLTILSMVEGAFAASPGSKPLELAQATRPLVSGERVRVKKLARDMESAMQTLNQGGVAPFQDPAYVEKWLKAVERYRQALARYPQLDDPDVQAAAAKLAELENMVAFGRNEAAKQSSTLGDVQAILAGIEEKLRANRAPQWLPPPFTEQEAQAWVQRAVVAKQVAQEAIAEIERIAPTAHLPNNTGTVQQGAPYDRQDLDRLHRFAHSITQDIGKAVQETTNNLKTQFEAQNRELDYFRGLDPEKDSDRMNAFLKEGAEAEIYGRLDKHLALARSVVIYQQALGHEPTASSTARVAEIVALRQTYAENRVKAIGDSRLPEPKSTDPARLAIAKEILANPDYEFGQHGPIVLTTEDIVDREKQVSRAEIKDVDVSLSGDITLSGTETTWNYQWQEFKFATPIKEAESGDWYIWWITAKNFSSGWERTPIGRWISGGATKGDLILEENFAN